jgi:hypothetical protein
MLLYKLVKSLAYTTANNFNKKYQDILTTILTPYIAISWLIVLFMVVDLYKYLFTTQKALIINKSLSFIMVETFFYCFCSVVWSNIFSRYKTKINQLLIHLNSNNILIIGNTYNTVSIIILLTSLVDLHIYFFLSFLFILFGIINEDIPSDVNDMYKSWNFLCDKIKESNTVVQSGSLSTYLWNIYTKYTDTLVENEIAYPVNITIQNNSQTQLLILHKGTETKYIHDKTIYLMNQNDSISCDNSNSDEEWENLEEYKNKTFICTYDEKALSHILISEKLVIIFNSL